MRPRYSFGVYFCNKNCSKAINWKGSFSANEAKERAYHSRLVRAWDGNPFLLGTLRPAKVHILNFYVYPNII